MVKQRDKPFLVEGLVPPPPEEKDKSLADKEKEQEKAASVLAAASAPVTSAPSAQPAAVAAPVAAAPVAATASPAAATPAAGGEVKAAAEPVEREREKREIVLNTLSNVQFGPRVMPEVVLDGAAPLQADLQQFLSLHTGRCCVRVCTRTLSHLITHAVQVSRLSSFCRSSGSVASEYGAFSPTSRRRRCVRCAVSVSIVPN